MVVAMGIDEVQEPFQWTNHRHQYYATIAANLIAVTQGSILGWLSPAIPILASNSTPLLSGPLTNEQISWVGSTNCLGGLLGSLLFGYLASFLGSKRVVLFLAAPYIAYWLFIYLGTIYYHILIGRFICGLTGGGVQSIVVLFIAEIANDDIRGRLASFMLLARNVGILMGYILGASFSYTYVPCISVIVPIIFFITFLMIPNTPRYYLQRGQNQKAEHALKYYKGYKGHSQHENSAICKELERLKTITNEQKKDNKIQLADFCNQSALKGLGIGMALVAFAQFSANLAIINYAVMTFARVGTQLDPYTSSIMLAVALICGSLTTTYLADKIGRKKLNLISLMGSAFGLQTTALYYYLNLIGYNLSAYAFIPVVCLSFVIFISSVGIVPLSLICSVEYLPSKIRTYGMAIVSGSFSIVNFSCIKIYPILLESVDLHGCLSIFAAGCIIGFLFVLFIVEETNGQSLDDVGVTEKTKLEHRHKGRLDSL